MVLTVRNSHRIDRRGASDRTIYQHALPAANSTSLFSKASNTFVAAEYTFFGDRWGQIFFGIVRDCATCQKTEKRRIANDDAGLMRFYAPTRKPL